MHSTLQRSDSVDISVAIDEFLGTDDEASCKKVDDISNVKKTPSTPKSDCTGDLKATPDSESTGKVEGSEDAGSAEEVEASQDPDTRGKIEMTPVTSEEAVNEQSSDEVEDESNVEKTGEVATTPKSVPEQHVMATPESKSTGGEVDSSQDPECSQQTTVVEATPEPEPQTTTTETQTSSESTPQEETTLEESESSQDIVLAGLPEENAPEAVEVDKEDKPTVEHDHIAISMIKKTTTHFRLRRTRPTLYRHDCVCLTHIRKFDAIDDGVQIAATGIDWALDGSQITVVLVASLGYTSSKNSRSTKLEDSGGTQIVLRDSQLDVDPLKWNHMFQLPCELLFRNGTPLRFVDTIRRAKLLDMVDKFVIRAEDNNEGGNWLDLQTFGHTDNKKEQAVKEQIERAKRLQEAINEKKRQQRRKKRECVQQNLQRKRELEKAKKEAKAQAQRERKAKLAEEVHYPKHNPNPNPNPNTNTNTNTNNNSRTHQARRRRYTMKIINGRLKELKVRMGGDGGDGEGDVCVRVMCVRMMCVTVMCDVCVCVCVCV